MSGFRRAQLRGSDELFQPTQPATDAESRAASTPPPAPAPAAPAKPEGRLVRLTDAEIETLTDAIQRLKFPHAVKASTKPSVDDFERLEDLRQKLLSVL